MARRTYHDDDDGRVIADMSSVERLSLMGHLPGVDAVPDKGAPGMRDWGSGRPDRHVGHADASGSAWGGMSDRARNYVDGGVARPRLDLTDDERRWAILGTFKAGLSIGVVYVVGLGLLILALVVIWNALA